MKMGLRWFGDGFDTVTLSQIRQVAGVRGVITTLYDTLPGKNGKRKKVLRLKEQVNRAGLEILGIESVNIHDDIKIGLPTRDRYIENYIETIRILAECGIDLICYNFMPVFDWTRTDLAKPPRPDGSTVLATTRPRSTKSTRQTCFAAMEQKADGHLLPGWEPERMARIQELFEQYRDVDEEKLWQNLKYFCRRSYPPAKNTA